MNRKPLKILVIRFSSIGDIVLTTPVIRNLKSQLPEATVHFCTKKNYASLLEANPYIDQLICLDNSLNELISRLKKEQYDYIIDLHNNLRTGIIKFRLGVKSYSLRKLNIEKWLLVNFKVNRLPDLHIVDRYMETVKELGVVNDGRGLDYFIPVRPETRSLPAGFSSGYTVLVTGARHGTKRMPLQKMTELCGKINGPLLLLGGEEDAEISEKLESLLRAAGRKDVYNACGKYSLHGSSALIRDAKRVFTHDTGMMHIASAFRKEVYSIWGSTVPEFGMYPYLTKHHILEVKGLSCRPCSKIGFNSCPKGHFSCMNKLDFSEIPQELSVARG